MGLINASLGGSRIVGWMSREMLQGYDDLLAEADRYSNPDFYEGQIRNNELQAKARYQNLDDMDPGRAHHWEEGTDDMAEGQVPSVIQVPVMFRDTALAGFCGSIWFRKKFRAGDEWSEKAARLWLGTIVDRDEVWLNGVFLGRTEYQYPPRKYDVPAGVIRGGDNSLVVRVVVDQGLGRFTPDKYYCLFEAGCSSPEEGGRIELSGQWEYWAGARGGRAPETDFVNWKATGLYNAMTAPCHDYPVAAVLWYQGESDTHEPYDYAEMTRRQIAGYRACWKDDLLPYIFVQLPRFSIDLDSDTQWPDLREKQRSALAVPGTAMAVAYDLGEDNDLHPLEKKELGRRMALLALTRCCGYQLEDSGPVPVRAVYYHEADTVRVRISLRHAKGLHTGPAEPGKDDGITDFEVLDTSGNHIVIRQVRVLAEEDAVELVCDGGPGCLEETLRGGNCRLSPGMIRYLYSNTNRGRMLYNSDRLPMGPFCMECTEA